MVYHHQQNHQQQPYPLFRGLEDSGERRGQKAGGWLYGLVSEGVGVKIAVSVYPYENITEAWMLALKYSILEAKVSRRVSVLYFHSPHIYYT